ncbi:hypothetical protein, partial [Serratia marcescens]|uniref:hypothetical protein n=1 Tax=Serratia marcescens TaxID=615 RepID=UPI001953F0DF
DCWSSIALAMGSVYKKQNGGFYKEIENTKVVARLRNYLVDGVLIEEGIEVLLQTLFQFYLE